MKNDNDAPKLEEANERIREAKIKQYGYLNLSFLNLTAIPDEVFELPKLELLILIGNKLTELPPKISQLKNLLTMSLNSNHITRLPKEIAELKNLRILDLGNNQLTELPREIAKLEKLTSLELSGNDLYVSLPSSIIEKGTRAVLNYLHALDGKIRVWTSKMVLVGEGGVGKTCLLDALEGKEFDPKCETTHGIDIRKLLLRYPNNEGICMDLNVWDFGGQDIYHATHQFYLTNHALFLLVWSARLGFEAGKVYKWLETIEALAPDSPILIVATNSIERGADLPKGDIRDKYGDKVHFYEVDNKNKHGIKELKQAIQQFAADLKYMGVERPKSWVNASKAIQQLGKKYISKKELFNKFTKAGVIKENHETLAIYLHELGDILFFPDEEELGDTIIIKPAWVSKHIARILDSKEVSKQAGFLHKTLMQKLWSDLTPHLQDKFITLMEKYDLSYKTENDVEISLIVEKLKYEEPPEYKKIWYNFQPAESEISFKYELETIPPGIPTWFIARTHRFSIHVHWRNGVLLQDKEKKHLGLVIARPENKEVWLKVRGIMPYYFFALLRDTLELTFNRFEGLKRITKVPCPGHKEAPCSHFFELEDIEKRIASIPPKLTIQCPKASEDEDVEIMEMLFGLSYAPGNPSLVERITQNVKKEIEKQNTRQTKQLVDEIKIKNEELIKFIQLEFIKSFKLQHRILDQTCPNIFTLKPKDSKFFQKPIDVDEFELQLYCHKPGCIHPVNEGKYIIKVHKRWLASIATYYNKMLNILKWAAPLIPAAGKIVGDYIKELPEIEIKPDHIKDFHKAGVNVIYTADGSELRNIRQLLEDLDKTRKWGGLERVVTPEGHILWLCKEHAREYK